MLGAVVVAAGALDVAAAGDGDNHFLFGNEVFHAHVGVVAHHDFRAAVIAEPGSDLCQFVADNAALHFRVSQDSVELGDHDFQHVVAVRDLLVFQGGQTTQLHVQDGLGLDLVDVQQLDQAVAGLFGGGGTPDQGNDLVQGVEGLQESAQNMSFFFCLAETEARAADNDVHLVRHPVADEGIQRQGARHAVNNRQHVGAEVFLQLSVLVEVVQHNLGHGVTLEDNHQSLAGTAGGLIAEVGDARNLAVLDQIGNLDGQVVRVGLERQLGDYQAGAALNLLNVDNGTHGDGAAARAVGIFDALAAQESERLWGNRVP